MKNVGMQLGKRNLKKLQDIKQANIMNNDGNTVIAEFDGWVKDNTQPDKYWNPTKNITHFHKPEDFEYHSSWDWLIEPIRKFRSLDLDNHEYKSHVQAIDDAVTDDYDIKQVFPTVVTAIKWHNKLITF